MASSKKSELRSPGALPAAGVSSLMVWMLLECSRPQRTRPGYLTALQAEKYKNINNLA